MIRLFLSLFLTLCLTLSVRAQSKHEYFGVSFTLPAGWEATESGQSEKDISVICTKKGAHGNTAVTILFKNSEQDAQDLLATAMVRYNKIMNDMGANVDWGM